MRHSSWMLCGMAALVLSVSPTFAQKVAGGEKNETPKADKADDGLAAMQAEMVKECGLSAEQATKLVDRVKAYKEAIAAWQKENGEKLAAAQKAGKGDQAAMEEAAALNASKAKLKADFDKEVDGILTPEQKAKWEAYQLFVSTCRKFSKANLTEVQKAKVRELTDATAKELAGTTEKGMKGTILDDLAAKVEALLTAEQKDAMAKKKVAQTEPAGDKPKDNPKGK